MQEKNINLQKACLSKRLYISYEDAVKARNRRSKKAKISLRIYKCSICKGYHLTSKVNSKVMQRKYGKRSKRII